MVALLRKVVNAPWAPLLYLANMFAVVYGASVTTNSLTGSAAIASIIGWSIFLTGNNIVWFVLKKPDSFYS